MYLALEWNSQMWLEIVQLVAGEEYTVMPVDQSGFFRPEFKKCVGAGYDLGPDEVTQYSFETGHISGAFDPRCGKQS